MKVYAFLNAAKTEGWGAWNGQAVAKLALAWHFSSRPTKKSC